jgi:hypothetical protein
LCLALAKHLPYESVRLRRPPLRYLLLTCFESLFSATVQSSELIDNLTLFLGPDLH